MTSEYSISPLTPAVDHLGESGHWDDRVARWPSLVWVNTPGKEVKRYHLTTGKITTVSTEKPVSFAVPRAKDDSLVIAQGDRLDFITEQRGEQSVFVPATALDLPENIATNDGKCDARGRLWFGTFQGASDLTSIQPVGSLYSVTGNGVVRQQASSFKLPNGLDWTADTKTMVLADSVQKAVFAFDFDVETGQISRQRRAFDFSSRPGMPDGLTIDAEDRLWVAFLLEGKVVRFDMNTGEELQTLEFPCSGTTCPSFGGKDLDEMYVTTTKLFQTPEQLKGKPLAGAVFRVTGLGVKGKAAHKFAG